MQRRALLACVPFATAGCLGMFTGTDHDDPESVVEAFIDATFEADVDEYRALLHEDSPRHDDLEQLVADADLLTAVSATVEHTDIVHEEPDRAIVAVRIRVVPPDDADLDHDPATIEEEIELVLTDAGWRIWV